MILIENIERFDSRFTLPINSITPCFLKKIRDENLNPESLLTDFINNNQHNRSSIFHSIVNQAAQLEILEYCRDHFDELITSSPIRLEAIINHFENQGWNAIISNNRTFKYALLDCFGYSRFRSSKKRGLWFAKQLNIKTCPYCNAQYTLYIEHKSKHSAKFQFDHFFSKDLYPYLSLSMYNLIPTCSSCNQSKSKIPTTLNEHFHPYHSDLSVSSRFRLEYPSDPSKLGLAELSKLSYKEMDVIFESKVSNNTVKEYIARHDSIYGLNGIYSRHKDIARDLLVKTKLYQGSGAKFLNQIEGLFPDKSSLMKYLLGSYTEESEINKRPLSKMIQDISKQLGLLP